MKKSLCLNFLLVSIAFSFYGQDVSFSNGQQFLVIQNPSFAGSNGGFRFQSSYKEQTTGRMLFVGTANTADFYLKKLKAGMAVSHTFDNFDRGILRNNTFAYSYAQHLSLADNKIKIIPSLQFAVIKGQLDRSKLSFGHAQYGQPMVVDEPILHQQKYSYDVSSGLIVNYKGFYFGASVFHVNKPNVGLLGDVFLPRRFSAYLSSNMALSKWAHVNVNLRYESQGGYNVIYLQANTLLADHFLFNLGYNTDSYGNVGLGYRGNFFTASLGYETSLANSYFYKTTSIQAYLSINIRDKDHRRSFTHFESQ